MPASGQLRSDQTNLIRYVWRLTLGWLHYQQTHGGTHLILGVATSAFGPGLVGLCLSYVLPLTDLIGSLLRTTVETEQEMVAVERVLQYTGIPAQARFWALDEGLGLDWNESMFGVSATTDRHLPKHVVGPYHNGC